MRASGMHLYTSAVSAVGGQNKIGRKLTLLALIQSTVIKQQAINNNWLQKLQAAVMLRNWQKSNFHQIEQDLQIHNPGEILFDMSQHILLYKNKKNSPMFINV